MEPGDLIADRFEIVARAGAGGTAVVYEARDHQTGGRVALKLLHESTSERDEGRFAREATALAQLSGTDHDGLVRYLGHGETPSHQRWLAMEWLAGQTLRERLDASGPPLAPREALVLVRRLADALAVAHASDLVHRDVKPSNVFLPDGDVARAKLIDFGLVRRPEALVALTRTGQIVGTPMYMAPEQARGDASPDARVDVFALGCILFECLVGRPAFQAPTMMAVLARILFEPSPRLADHGVRVPAPLDGLLARMLAKFPDERPADARAVLAALDAMGAVEARVRTRTRAPSLSPRERRLVSVIAGRARGDVALLLSELRLAAAPWDVEVEALLDGSIVALVTGAGAPTEHAARAARCAEALSACGGDRLALALTTGWGVVAGGSEPMGPVIERAAELLMRVRTGQLLVDRPTASLLRGARFDVVTSEHGAVLRQAEDAPARQDRRSPFVGRARELTLLRETFQAVVREPLAAAVLVTGPIGAGKTRLLEAFLDEIGALDAAPRLLRAAHDPSAEGAGLPFALLRAALADAGSAPAPTPETLDADRTLDGTDEGVVAATDRARAALLAALDVATESGPTVLVLDDLHHAGRPTLQLLDVALRRLEGRPWLLLAAARPELEERATTLWPERDVLHLRLPGLADRAAGALVRHALGEDADEEAVARCVSRADGNPLFLEELARADLAGDDAVPDTVLGVLQARLARLPEPARLLIRAASVFGTRFRPAGVQALLGGDRGPLATLPALEEAGLVRPTGPDATAWAVAHDLVREAAYATLPPDERRLGHRLAAAWLEEQAAAPAVLAHHYEASEQPERAGPCWLRAARAALEAGDLERAIAHGRAGVRCEPAPADGAALLLIQAVAHRWRAEPEALDVATASQALAEPGSAAWFRATGERINALGRKGAVDALCAEIDVMMAAWPVPEPTPAHVKALHQASAAIAAAGDFRRAVDIQEDVRARCGDLIASRPLLAARFERVDAHLGMKLGNVLEGLGAYERSVTLFERGGDPRNAAVQWIAYGYQLAELGQLEQAEDLLRRSLATAEAVAAPVPICLGLQNLGHVLTELGRHAEAEDVLTRAIRFAAERAYPKLEAAARRDRAELLAATGEPEAALAEARRAVDLLGGFPALRATVQATVARLQLAAGDAEGALATSTAGVAVLEELGGVEEREAGLRLVHAEALAATGDHTAAHRALRGAWDRLAGDLVALEPAPALRESCVKRRADHLRIVEAARAAGWLPT